MIRVLAPALAVLVLALGVPAQEKGDLSFGKVTKGAAPATTIATPGSIQETTIVDLGNGRSRLRHRMTPSEQYSQEIAGEGARVAFLERWLARELPLRFKTIGIPEMVQVRRHRLDEPESRATNAAYLEVAGPHADIVAVRDFLDGLLGDRVRLIEAEFIIVEVGLEHMTVDGAPEVKVLNAQEMTQRLRSVRTRDGSNVLISSRLSLLNGQSGSVSLLNEEAYVKDFEVVVAQGAAIADPIIDVIRDGITIDFGGLIHPSGEQLTIESCLRLATLKRPIATIETDLPLDGADSVTIQLPEVRFTEWSSEQITLDLDRDVGFMLRGLKYVAPDRDWDEALTAVELYCRVKVTAVKPGGVCGGRVLAYDAAEKLVTARFEAVEGPALPRTVAILRDQAEVGRARLEERQGSLLLLRLESGEAKPGDTLR